MRSELRVGGAGQDVFGHFNLPTSYGYLAGQDMANTDVGDACDLRWRGAGLRVHHTPVREAGGSISDTDW